MKSKDQIIIYNTDDNKVSIALFSKDGQVWMNQKQLTELFETSKQNISLHIVNILKDKELREDSVVKEYLTTASDGKDYNEYPVLKHKGEISQKQAKENVKKVYEQYDKTRKIEEAQQADKEDEDALRRLEQELKNRKK